MEYIKPLNDDAYPERLGAYVNANPSLGIPGSTVPGEALQHSMTEIINAITAAGLTPDDADLTQLLQAIKKIPSDASNYLYEGQDLTTKFADEITTYSDDPWAWIKARITAADYNGLNIGDYIPFSMGGNAIKAQIAGIDIYYRANDVETGHHIDFISQDCYPTPVPWNTTNVNNGNATNAAPWMVCNLKNIINTTWYNSLPAALKAQIIEKRAYLETRYTSGSTLIESTGAVWNDIGKLWVPSEGEVYGAVHWSTKGYSSMQNAEYPIFAASWRNRIKGIGDGGTRCYWWLLSVSGGTSAYVCRVSSGGVAGSANASYAAICAPVCFRIG